MTLPFDSNSYGPEIATILQLDGGAGGLRPMDLYPRASVSETARNLLLKADAARLFPGGRDPELARSGLFLYFSCLKEAHDLYDDSGGTDTAYWHGIMHRMEGDSFNAGYWFRRVGPHPVFPALAAEAAKLGYMAGRSWDPFAFIRFCESSAGKSDEDLAKRIQLAEWHVLFDFCARPVRAAASKVTAS